MQSCGRYWSISCNLFRKGKSPLVISLMLLNIKASSHIVFDGIQRYCNTLAQPMIQFWIPSNTLNTVKYWVLQIEHVSGTIPWNTRSATVGNHGNASDTARYLWQPWILKLSSFQAFPPTDSSEAATERWRPQTICSRASGIRHCVYSNKSCQNINIYRQLQCCQPKYSHCIYPGIWRYLDCQHQIPGLGARIFWIFLAHC